LEKQKALGKLVASTTTNKQCVIFLEKLMKGKPPSIWEEKDPSSQSSSQEVWRRTKVHRKNAGLEGPSTRTQRNWGISQPGTHFQMEECFKRPMGPNPLCKSP
jgi:hypothetical protein